MQRALVPVIVMAVGIWLGRLSAALPATGAAPPPSTTGTWVTVAEFASRGALVTPPVTVGSARWRVRWTAEPTSSGIRQVCFSMRNVRTGALALNGCNQADGESYGYAGPGEYAIDVSGVNGGWTLAVDDFR